MHDATAHGHAGQPVRTELVGIGATYAIRVRCVIVAGISVLVILGADQDDRLGTTAIAVTVTLCSLAHLVVQHRVRVQTWFVLADLAVLVAMCLTQVWTVPAHIESHGSTWVCGVVSIYVITCQWVTRMPVSIACALLLITADMVGAAIAGPDRLVDALPFGAWFLVEALLSLAARRLLLARAKLVDAAIARTQAAAEAEVLAAARRRAECLHVAALHDTASTTLLLASTPQDDTQLAEVRAQAGRDLQRLNESEPDAERLDLIELLAGLLRRCTSSVRAELPEYLVLPARLAEALHDCVREALRNVDRHAPASAVRVSVTGDEQAGVVLVSDDGAGFDPDAVPITRRGISHSILGRAESVGARARIDSAPGKGVTITVEWSRAQ